MNNETKTIDERIIEGLVFANYFKIVRELESQRKGNKMRPYYGPRFYRLQVTTKGGQTFTRQFGNNRSLALSTAREVFIPIGDTCVLETTDDRYPANVRESEPVKA